MLLYSNYIVGLITSVGRVDYLLEQRSIHVEQVIHDCAKSELAHHRRKEPQYILNEFDNLPQIRFVSYNRLSNHLAA